MASLAELRKNRSALMEKVNKSLDEKNKGNQDDDRFWKLKRNEAGNGSAILRFLPPMDGDELPWVTTYSRGFKHPVTNRWYINEDLSTIGQEDPVYHYLKPIYERNNEDEKKSVSEMKRRTQYISNVLIIKDPSNPENEGKVKLFKYGPKILSMITGKMKPDLDDEQPVFVYDILEGANFRLKARIVADQVNYDQSSFDTPTELCDGDEDKMEAVIKQYVPLAEFTDPKKFKSYEQLKKELNRVLGTSEETPSNVGKASDLVDEKPKAQNKPKKEEAAPWADEEEKKEEPAKKATVSSASTDDDDDMAQFEAMLSRS